MLRYFCRDFTGNPRGDRQSAEFMFRPAPPLMTIIIFDYASRETWGIRYECWNAQSRQSLESLRPSDAWRRNCGFDGRGEFRAIRPTSLFDMLPLVLSFNVEVSWFPAFANLTTQIDNSFLLFSVRPESGTGGWTRLHFGPPQVVYIRPEDLLVNHSGQAQTSTVNVSAPVTLVQVTQNNTVTNQAPVEPSRGSNDPPPPEVEIIEEAPRNLPFSRPALDAIPFTHPPFGGQENHSAITRMHAVQRPITLEEFDPMGMLPFELAMQFVREENAARLGAHFGTRLAPVNSVQRDGNYGALIRPIRNTPPENHPIIQEINPDTSSRPSPEIILEPVSTPVVLGTQNSTRLAPIPITSSVANPVSTEARPIVIPKPPSTPKPRPPPFLPGQLPLISRPRLTPSMALTMRTISNLSARFHPRLRTIEYLRPDQLVEPCVTRTGAVNPVLPKANPITSTSYGTPPSSLRTTSEGIRLEITPEAMIQRRLGPGNHAPSSTPPSPVPESRPSLPPELDPEQ